MQEGISCAAAAEAAVEAELEYVENRCIKVVHRELLG
ncbi:hypothetical protein [Oceanimonas baumannii]|nr:hypothetical protein [Oceanimonas baumannii]